jgi:3-phenylpropionate/cinnamic acid dioxygenase small subunit
MNPSSELLDRLQIEHVLRLYALGLDERRFELWSQVFTEDAVIDFTPAGGKRERPAEMAARLSATDANWLFAQHPLFNSVIEVDGDTAVAHSDYGIETGRRPETGSGTEIVRTSGGGSYRDVLRRTDAGWRIAERVVYLKWRRTETGADELARLRSPLP